MSTEIHDPRIRQPRGYMECRPLIASGGIPADTVIAPANPTRIRLIVNVAFETPTADSLITVGVLNGGATLVLLSLTAGAPGGILRWEDVGDAVTGQIVAGGLVEAISVSEVIWRPAEGPGV
jgi:hypothetical protein